MITLLTGDNSFELTRALSKIVSAFDGEAEQFEGNELLLHQLPDLLLGATLFSDKRLVIIKNLHENKTLWEVLPVWLGRMDADTHVVLIEQKPDKRTKTYKDLKRYASVKEFVQWNERDSNQIISWVVSEASNQGFVLNKNSAQILVERVGADQWQLYNALQKLSVIEKVDSATIEAYIETTPSENVFNLLDAALRGDARRVMIMVKLLQRTQEPYMTFGLLSGQVFQLAALVFGDKQTGDVAVDIGAHPYALSKLAPHAKKIGPVGVRKIANYFAEVDSSMKSSATDPWTLIEQALIKTTSIH